MARHGTPTPGQAILEGIEWLKMDKAEFARRINCARPNVYSIFERYDIGVEQLIDISEALDHNFFDDIQLKSGLTSSLQTRQMNVRFNLESFSEEKAERIGILLKELKELVEE